MKVRLHTFFFIFQISPPAGWAFNPPEYHLKVDGATDMCSMGVDINFDFNGFSVNGNVVTQGFTEGPTDVSLTLTGTEPNSFKLETKSMAGGVFSFDSIPPGTYTLTSSQPGLSYEKNSHVFTITNENIKIQNQVFVEICNYS